MIALGIAMLVLGGVSLLFSDEPRGAATSHEEEVAPEGDATRLREGAALTDQAGKFQLVGDRVIFHFDGERQVTVLENLALERVTRVVRQDSSTQTWIVSGVLTEYQGNNFLLIERAILSRRRLGA
jgi:hypothetical protein